MRKKNLNSGILQKAVCLIGTGMLLVACAPGGKEAGETAAALAEEQTGQESEKTAAWEETQQEQGNRQEASQESDSQKPEENPENEQPEGIEETDPEVPEDETEQKTEEKMTALLAEQAQKDGDSVQVDGYTIQPMKVEQEMKSQDQSYVYITFEAQYPKITMDADAQTADKINAAIEAEVISRLGSLTEYEEWAKEEYTWRESVANEQGDDLSWQPYVAEMSYTIERADGKILSFLFLNYDYLGGAHGGHALYGMTFDVETGEKLSLETLGESEQAVRDEVEPILIQQAEKIQEKFENGESDLRLFEEYAEYMPDVLTDNTWYLTEEGMEVVANEYLLAPYAAGPVTFQIPYEQTGFMKEQYLP